MPASYAILSNWRIKYVRISGTIELEELLELAREYFEDPKFDPSARFFVDLRELTSSAARFRDVTELYGYYRRQKSRFDGPINVAIVAPNDFSFGLARMFSAMAEMDTVVRLQIFRCVSDAARWLKLPVDVAQSFRPVD